MRTSSIAVLGPPVLPRVLLAGVVLLIAAAAVAASTPTVSAAPLPNDSCVELQDPALDETVLTTVSATGVTVSWSYTGAPSYARACVWLGGSQDGEGYGVLDRFLAAGTTSRFFAWSEFNLDVNPCIGSPEALFRGGVHIADIALSRRGTFAGCPAPDPTGTPDPTASPSAEPTAAPTAAPTATPTVAPTAAPSASPTAAPTADPTPSPSPEPTGDVAPALGTPNPTLPPTDGRPAGSRVDGDPSSLALLFGILGGAALIAGYRVRATRM